MIYDDLNELKNSRTWSGGAVTRIDQLYRHACGLRGKNWSVKEITRELTTIWKRCYVGFEIPLFYAEERFAEMAESVMQLKANAIGNDTFWFAEPLISEMATWFEAQDRPDNLEEINHKLKFYITRTGKSRRVTPIKYLHIAMVSLAIAKAMWEQIHWNEHLLEWYEIPYDYIKPCSGITDGTRIMAAIRFLKDMNFYRVKEHGTFLQCDAYAPGETSEAAPDSLTNLFAEIPDF